MRSRADEGHERRSGSELPLPLRFAVILGFCSADRTTKKNYPLFCFTGGLSLVFSHKAEEALGTQMPKRQTNLDDFVTTTTR